MTGPTTGWPPSVLMQDDDRHLSKALANTPGARRHAEEAAADIVLATERRLHIAVDLGARVNASAAIVLTTSTGLIELVPVFAVDLDVEPAP